MDMVPGLLIFGALVSVALILGNVARDVNDIKTMLTQEATPQEPQEAPLERPNKTAA